MGLCCVNGNCKSCDVLWGCGVYSVLGGVKWEL